MEAIIAVAMMGILVNILIQGWSFVAGLKQKANTMNDRIDIVMALRDQIDCTTTLAALSPTTLCDSVTPAALNLLDANNKTLVPKVNGTLSVTTEYTGRATCNKKNDYIDFNVYMTITKPTSKELPVFANVAYKCPIATATPPPTPPTGSCPESSCTCPNTMMCCFYNSSATSSFCAPGSTPAACPGSPTKTAALSCAPPTVPAAPAGSCQQASCACSGSFVCCFYGSMTSSYCVPGTTSSACPGSPTKTLALACVEAI